MCRAPAANHRSESLAGPSQPISDPTLRASDAEREGVAERLRQHAAEGRLRVEELEERLAAAFSARTRGELEPLLSDLPGRSPLVAPQRPRRRAAQLPPLAVLALALVAVWALTGAGYFWPLWPILAVFWFGGPWGRRGLACGHRRRGRPAPGAWV